MFVVDELKNIYMKNSSFPDSKVLVMHFRDRPEIGAKHVKNLMPFVDFCQKSVQEANGSIHVLDQHMSFNEYETLLANQEYIKRSLKSDRLDIKLIKEVDEETPDSTMNNLNLDAIEPGMCDLVTRRLLWDTLFLPLGKPMIIFRVESTTN